MKSFIIIFTLIVILVAGISYYQLNKEDPSTNKDEKITELNLACQTSECAPYIQTCRH